MIEPSIVANANCFELLISQLSEFVIVLASPGGNFNSWHPGVELQFGYTANEFIGQNVELLFTPADRMKGTAAEELKAAAENGRVSDTRWLMKKNGKRILVEGVTIGLREDNGRLAGFGKVLRDVTERKIAEDHLRALTGALDQSTVLVRRWDGVIDHWTAGCASLYGWTAQEAVGQIAHVLLKTNFPEPLERIHEQLRASGTWKGELEHVKRDGSRLCVATRWVLSNDSTGGAPPVIETHTDITARLEIQRELEAVNERLKRMAVELERSNEELEEFARIASHDLSAPITSTRWLVDLLSSRHADKLDPSGQRCLKEVSQGLERMAELVQAVLTHAQLGKSAIGSSVTTHAETALQIALDNLRKDIEGSGAVISHDALPELLIEPQALSQLLQNVLSNAIKYRKPGTRLIIKISVVREGSMWLIGVQDNGIGIETECFERIFQPMQRLHGAEIAGSGIGLATCKKIVTRAGGKIWVESQLGSGSTFFFTLPGPPVPQLDGAVGSVAKDGLRTSVS
ncbi:MAG: PAS domain-containing sensor histidine kinase [Bryobacteraceae bacterium]